MVGPEVLGRAGGEAWGVFMNMSLDAAGGLIGWGPEPGESATMLKGRIPEVAVVCPGGAGGMLGVWTGFAGWGRRCVCFRSQRH